MIARRYGVLGIFIFALTSTGALANYPFNGITQGQLDISPQGAAVYSIPIAVPPGVNGLQPNLSLVYNSQAGNGPLGVGWGLSGLSSISRCPATLDQDGFTGGINFNTSDRFCLDGQRLVVVSGSYGVDNSKYRTEVDSLSNITAYDTITSNSGPEYFIVKTKDGKTLQYGGIGNSGVKQQGGNGSYIAWNLAKITDSSLNTIDFTYSSILTFNSQGYYPIVRIDYNTRISTVSTSVRFSYAVRTDVINNYLAGSKLFIPERMTNIKTYLNDEVIRDYRVTYIDSPSTSRSLVSKILDCEKSVPSLCRDVTFTSATPTLLPNQASMKNPAGVSNFWSRDGYHEGYADVNGDGKDDRIWVPNGIPELYVALANSEGTGFNQATIWLDSTRTNGKAVYSFNGMHEGFGDVNGDGLADKIWLPYGLNELCVALSNGSYFNDASCMDATSIAGVPLWSANGYHEKIADVNGDGRADRVWIPWGQQDIWVALSNGVFFSTPTQWLKRSTTDFQLWSGNGWHESYVDVNGDGKSDRVWVPNARTELWVALANSNGTGFDQPTIWLDTSMTGNRAVYSFSGQHESYGDVNGDGLADRLWLPYGSPELCVALSTGKSFSRVSVCMNSSQAGGKFLYSDRGMFENYGDINGDGRVDRIWMPYGLNELWIATFNGTTFDNGVRWMDGAASLRPLYSYYGRHEGYADINGDGIVDRVWVPHGQNELWLSISNPSGIKPDLLVSSTDGVKNVTNINYKPLTDTSVYTKYTNPLDCYPICNIQNATYVVAQVSSPNGIGGTNTVGYRYEGAKMHSRGRGYLGFARTVQTDYATNIVTVTNFYQKSVTTDDYLLTPTSKDFWKTGNLYYRYQTYNGSYIGYETYYWSVRTSDVGVVLPIQSSTTQYNYDFGTQATYVRTYIPNPAPTTSNPIADVDQYGNVLKKVIYTHDNLYQKQYTQTIDTTYYPADSINWRVGLVDTITATNVVPDEREGFAGGTTTAINKTKYEYHPNSFLVQNEITDPALPASSSLRLTKSYLYDLYGNQSRVTVSGAGISPVRETQTAYDFNYAADKYRVVITNALNHTEERFYDWRTGNMLAMIGPNRILSSAGFTTEWRYDGFGRKTQELRVDGTVTNWSYRCINIDCSPTASREVTFATETTAGKPAVTTYFDQLGR